MKPREFITSDIHFSHRGILNFCPKSRPFANVEEMDEKIIQYWNQDVSHDDTVYILGDVSFAGREDSIKIMKRLNGKKILITGNHDKKLLKDYHFRLCFDQVHDYLELNHYKHKLVMFHFPIWEWNQIHRGAIHFHGHVHGGPTGILGRIKDVGMDTNMCQVYELDRLVKSMLQYEIRTHHNKVGVVTE